MARLEPSPHMQQRRAALLPLLERALRLTDPLLQLVDRGRVGRSMRRRESFSACSVASSSPSAVSSRSRSLTDRHLELVVPLRVGVQRIVQRVLGLPHGAHDLQAQSPARPRTATLSS